MEQVKHNHHWYLLTVLLFGIAMVGVLGLYLLRNDVTLRVIPCKPAFHTTDALSVSTQSASLKKNLTPTPSATPTAKLKPIIKLPTPTLKPILHSVVSVTPAVKK